MSPFTEDVFVRSVGALILLDWLSFQPFFTVAFRPRDKQPPLRADKLWCLVINALWLVAGFCLLAASGIWRLAALVIFYGIFRYYFIQTRWSSIRRGFGAPGFMSHWVIFYLLLIESSAWLDSSGRLPSAVLTLMRFDFALIILCAGVCKMLSGYFVNAGMEYGGANPIWGYYWKSFQKTNPRARYVRLMNCLASGIEMGAGISMLIPNAWTQVWGGLAISLSFLYISALIRLGRLAFLMALIPVIYTSTFGQSICAIHQFIVPPVLPPSAIFACQVLIKVIMALLLGSKVVQYLNFFANWRAPEPLQSVVNWFGNLWPVIIWRVFTVDVTNFFIRIYSISSDGVVTRVVHEAETYSYRDWKNLRLKLRFLQVTESIALVSVFTTRKYFPSRPELFYDKLVRYAQSVALMLPEMPQALRFEYMSIEKSREKFLFVPKGSFKVDLTDLTMTEEQHVRDYDDARPTEHSWVRECSAGTYTPRTR
jgi:hypothetical protein